MNVSFSEKQGLFIIIQDYHECIYIRDFDDHLLLT
jgi:hypothetical protein